MIEAREALATEFQLTTEDRTALLPSGRQAVFDNRVAWAKVYLQRARLLDSPRRGHFRISERGRDVLRDPPERVTVKYLERFPEFVEFRSATKERREAGGQSNADVEGETPEETLESAYQRIDGIINEDRLGLDVIYLQAKKWDGTVGRPEIQKFVGALHGKRAKKGIFITTGTFSAEAAQYVATIDPKVVLIDGQQLANLMIDWNVGVSPVASYETKRIDSDYFTEE